MDSGMSLERICPNCRGQVKWIEFDRTYACVDCGREVAVLQEVQDDEFSFSSSQVAFSTSSLRNRGPPSSPPVNPFAIPTPSHFSQQTPFAARPFSHRIPSSPAFNSPLASAPTTPLRNLSQRNVTKPASTYGVLPSTPSSSSCSSQPATSTTTTTTTTDQQPNLSRAKTFSSHLTLDSSTPLQTPLGSPSRSRSYTPTPMSFDRHHRYDNDNDVEVELFPFPPILPPRSDQKAPASDLIEEFESVSEGLRRLLFESQLPMFLQLMNSPPAIQKAIVERATLFWKEIYQRAKDFMKLGMFPLHPAPHFEKKLTKIRKEFHVRRTVERKAAKRAEEQETRRSSVFNPFIRPSSTPQSTPPAKSPNNTNKRIRLGDLALEAATTTCDDEKELKDVMASDTALKMLANREHHKGRENTLSLLHNIAIIVASCLSTHALVIMADVVRWCNVNMISYIVPPTRSLCPRPPLWRYWNVFRPRMRLSLQTLQEAVAYVSQLKFDGKDEDVLPVYSIEPFFEVFCGRMKFDHSLRKKVWKYVSWLMSLVPTPSQYPLLPNLMGLIPYDFRNDLDAFILAYFVLGAKFRFNGMDWSVDPRSSNSAPAEYVSWRKRLVNANNCVFWKRGDVLNEFDVFSRSSEELKEWVKHFDCIMHHEADFEDADEGDADDEGEWNAQTMDMSAFLDNAVFGSNDRGGDTSGGSGNGGAVDNEQRRKEVTEDEEEKVRKVKKLKYKRKSVRTRPELDRFAYVFDRMIDQSKQSGNSTNEINPLTLDTSISIRSDPSEGKSWTYDATAGEIAKDIAAIPAPGHYIQFVKLVSHEFGIRYPTLLRMVVVLENRILWLHDRDAIEAGKKARKKKKKEINDRRIKEKTEANERRMRALTKERLDKEFPKTRGIQSKVTENYRKEPAMIFVE